MVQIAGVVVLLGWLVLVGRGLLARQLSTRRMLLLALAWIAIFAAVWAVARLVER
ncbi:MAG: hypothetical protein JOY99_02365 [Sphingomonadaceae bacterium]|nr:hypothetical protein [Sphingomonadaceae bacterium]